jgi:hypothetical protein
MSRTLLETRGALSAAACMHAGEPVRHDSHADGWLLADQAGRGPGGQPGRPGSARTCGRCCPNMRLRFTFLWKMDHLPRQARDRQTIIKKCSKRRRRCVFGTQGTYSGSALSAHATPCGTNWTTLEVRGEHETAQKRLLFELHVSSRLSRACLGKPSLLFSLKIDSLRSIP